MGEFNLYFLYWEGNSYWLSDKLRDVFVEVVMKIIKS